MKNENIYIQHALNTGEFKIISTKWKADGYCKETNTIYQPKLEVVYDDSLFDSSSLSPVTGSAEDGYKVIITNLKKEYTADSKIQIRVKGRDMYPLKSFGTTFAYDQSKYITNMYYQLEDYITGEIIFPFGDYTKVSCDSNGNFFKLNLSNCISPPL